METSPDDIIVCAQPLPGTIKAFSHRLRDGKVWIVVNSYLDKDGQQKALRHELKHVERNDFDKDEPTKLIEATI